MDKRNDFGQTIAELRRNAGFSQKSLAEVLCITDKAVSKWERGLSFPDISLLPRLSALLDSDIEPLLIGFSVNNICKWRGVLKISNYKLPLDIYIFDKPLVYYLISNFLLVGITDITVVCTKEQQDIFEKYIQAKIVGTHIKLTFVSYIIEKELNKSNVFEIESCYFLFSASLTRQYQAFMSNMEGSINVIQSNGLYTPLFFYTKDFYNKPSALIQKKLSRGVVCIPLDTYENILDAADFVRIYQKYHSQKISDITEILKSRHF